MALRPHDDHGTPAVRSDRAETPTRPRRGLRLHEAIALAMLCVIMAGAWIVTLSG